METWETETRGSELRGEAAQPLQELDEEAAQILRERLAEREPCVARLREIEGQVSRCLNVAEETRQAILRGDQVRIINASTIAKCFVR